MTGAMLTSIGLVFDMIGAVLVAIEVVKGFKGARTVDVGGSGTLNGGFSGVENPKFTAYEKRRRRIMGIGLAFLLVGFAVQIVGTWVSYSQSSQKVSPQEGSLSSQPEVCTITEMVATGMATELPTDGYRLNVRC